MGKASAAVDDLPTEKVDTGNYSVHDKNEQTISSAKPPRLFGKNSDCLLQIRVTG